MSATTFQYKPDVILKHIDSAILRSQEKHKTKQLRRNSAYSSDTINWYRRIMLQDMPLIDNIRTFFRSDAVFSNQDVFDWADEFFVYKDYASIGLIRIKEILTNEDMPDLVTLSENQAYQIFSVAYKEYTR